MGAPTAEPLALAPTFGSPAETAPAPESTSIARGETLAVGSHLQVVSRRVTLEEEAWVQVRVCALPGSPVPPPEAAYQPGAEGWILEATLLPRVTPGPTPDAPGVGGCPIAPGSR